MSGIICVLRGGMDSRATIASAVALALDNSQPVHFLYIVNRDLVSDLDQESTQAVVERLRQMGNSTVLVAQAIANSHGVSARGAVRYGSLEEEIGDLCQEVGADCLILGESAGDHPTDVFTPERLARFRARMKREAGIDVVVAKRDSRQQSSTSSQD